MSTMTTQIHGPKGPYRKDQRNETATIFLSKLIPQLVQISDIEAVTVSSGMLTKVLVPSKLLYSALHSGRSNHSQWLADLFLVNTKPKKEWGLKSRSRVLGNTIFVPLYALSALFEKRTKAPKSSTTVDVFFSTIQELYSAPDLLKELLSRDVTNMTHYVRNALQQVRRRQRAVRDRASSTILEAQGELPFEPTVASKEPTLEPNIEERIVTIPVSKKSIITFHAEMGQAEFDEKLKEVIESAVSKLVTDTGHKATQQVDLLRGKVHEIEATLNETLNLVSDATLAIDQLALVVKELKDLYKNKKGCSGCAEKAAPQARIERPSNDDLLSILSSISKDIAALKHGTDRQGQEAANPAGVLLYQVKDLVRYVVGDSTEDDTQSITKDCERITAEQGLDCNVYGDIKLFEYGAIKAAIETYLGVKKALPDTPPDDFIPSAF